MASAKSRERKCSTCKHYQPSPLWRKGWCRNPLLYDRNTNHLVEADSLACNRTFIDYWEPATERTGPAGSNARGTRPRIAPSIPMQPMDASGEPATGPVQLTPTQGTPVPGSRGGYQPTSPLDVAGRAQRPPLSLVDDDYEDLEDTQSTAEMPALANSQPATRMRRGRTGRAASNRRGAGIWPLSGLPLYALMGTLAVALVLAAAFLIFNRQSPLQQPGATPRATTTAAASGNPTPTGFGDPTATLPAIATVGAGTPGPTGAAPSVIAVGGFVEVSGTGDGLVVRDAPAGGRIAKIADGTRARVVDGPREANGFQWWKVDRFNKANPALSGWCAADYLKATSTAP